MKPCSRNRKRIVWLTLGALEASQARELQTHLQACGPCRRYLQELTAVEEKLIAAQPMPDVQASESFHRQFARRLAATAWRSPAGWSRAFAACWRHWRVALPATAVAVLVAVALAKVLWRPESPSPARSQAQATVPAAPKSDLEPTVANYRQAASRSFDDFDDLLMRQALTQLAPAPLYTARAGWSLGAAD